MTTLRRPARAASPRSRLALLVLMLLLLLPAGCSSAGHDGPSTPTGSLSTAIRHTLRYNLYADQIRALLVHHGTRQVLAEYHDTTPSTYRKVDATTTTVLSALAGIALDEGYLHSVDQPLEELLPAEAADLPQRLRGVTLEQL